MQPKLITEVDLPVEICDRLADALSKESARKELLMDFMKGSDKDPDVYTLMENNWIQSRDEANDIKQYITDNVVPIEYRDYRYMWNFNGRPATSIQILEIPAEQL